MIILTWTTGNYTTIILTRTSDIVTRNHLFAAFLMLLRKICRVTGPHNTLFSVCASVSHRLAGSSSLVLPRGAFGT